MHSFIYCNLIRRYVIISHRFKINYFFRLRVPIRWISYTSDFISVKRRLNHFWCFISHECPFPRIFVLSLRISLSVQLFPCNIYIYINWINYYMYFWLLHVIRVPYSISRWSLLVSYCLFPFSRPLPAVTIPFDR